MTTAHGTTPGLANFPVHSARLRTIGVMVLILGISGAGMVYWWETRSAQLNNDPAMTGYSGPETQQMETMYGTMGTMTDDLFNALKRPGVQATIIAGISIIVAGVCFYFSRPATKRATPGPTSQP